MAETKITSNNFNDEVINSDIPVLLDFYANWCGPCKMLSPIVEEIADEYEGKLKVGKVNVDDEPELSASFQVSSIPLVVLIKDGKSVNSFVGYREKKQVEDFIRQEVNL